MRRVHEHGQSPHDTAGVLRLTERVRALGTESAFGVAEEARRLERQGRDVVHLEIGEPGIETPPHIVEAGVRALRDGLTHYTSPAGIPALRDALAAVARDRGIPAAAENVVVTSGAKPAILYALLALVHEGDDVLVPDPGFPIYPSVARLAGGRPVPYPVDLDGDGEATAQAIAAAVTSRTRVLVLNAPHNPTGAILSARALDTIGELALAHDLAIVSDEVYARLRFTGSHESIAARPGLAERTVVVDSFSKAYAMTGWRLGCGVMPPALAERVTRLVVNDTSCAPPFVQHAGLAALQGPQHVVGDLVHALRRSRDLLVHGLGTLDGITCPAPAAAFFVFPDASGLLARTATTADQLAAHVLQSHGVATLAGSGFGARGAARLRLSFAATPERLHTALERLRACVADHSCAAVPRLRRA